MAPRWRSTLPRSPRLVARGASVDPQRFVGAIPFPSVSYDEEAYHPDKWWRGPMWPPVAYFMLEILRKYGYDHEYQEIAGRLYTVMLQDGHFCECFNSQTGAGMGCNQQSWTAALLLHLNKHLQGVPSLLL
ncbi:MGH1-like glycoside hydrolase domain-containing protein [Dictyobacter halimunensis]|uniref:MGH1-like glycoside hydrolase domain-containing protein n=1 Tax=Dictyobacter halimunensis TaxID=3026934 RepID=UPI003B982F6C